MEYRIKDSAKGYAEPIKNRPGSFRLYFSLGKDPSTGKYLRSPKRTYHCKSKNPKNWKSECDKALEAYKDELLGTSRSSDPVSYTHLMNSLRSYSRRLLHTRSRGSTSRPMPRPAHSSASAIASPSISSPAALRQAVQMSSGR